jgi:hypothetical protein
MRYRCARGHRSFPFTTERPVNSGIYHGFCGDCDDYVWAYAEWDEPVPGGVVFARMLPLSGSST